MSKSDDGLNFHLRIIVQPIAIAPTQDAMTMITVSAALGTDDVEAPETVVAESLLLVALASDVTVCVTRLTDFEVCELVLSALSLFAVFVGAGAAEVSVFVG